MLLTHAIAENNQSANVNRSHSRIKIGITVPGKPEKTYAGLLNSDDEILPETFQRDPEADGYPGEFPPDGCFEEQDALW